MPKWVERGLSKEPTMLETVGRRLKRVLNPKVTPVIDALLAKVALSEEVPHVLLRKVAVLESRLIPDAVSSTGAVGLMQLTRGAQRDVSATLPDGVRWIRGVMAEPMDPEENLRVGARYLRIVAQYLGRSVDEPADWPAVYVAYNIGAGNAAHVLAGRPERAAEAIAKQAYGEPAAYLENVKKALARA